MWWKAYFWIVAILIILGLFAPVLFPGEAQKFTLIDWVGIILSVPSLAGLFAFVYKKEFLNRQQWKLVFWVTIVVDAFYLFYSSLPVKDIVPEFLRVSTTSGIESVLSLAFELPILYALYQLVYNPQWNLRQEDRKTVFIMVSLERTGWWKIASIALVVYGFLYLIVLAGNLETVVSSTNDDKIAVAIIGLLQIIVGILVWYRINLALFLATAFFTFRAIALLGGGLYGEFFFNTLVLVSLFVLILKSQTSIHKT